MTPQHTLELLVPLLFSIAFGVVWKELRTHQRERRIRRITQRLLE